MDQLTGAFIGWPLFILWTLAVLAIAVSSIGLFWVLRELLRLAADQIAIWRQAKPRAGLGNEQGKLRAALRKARRAGPSDQSGDGEGMPVIDLSGLTREQEKYIERIRRAENSYDPKYVIGGPNDESGDDGGHPIRSEPFWRER